MAGLTLLHAPRQVWVPGVRGGASVRHTQTRLTRPVVKRQQAPERARQAAPYRDTIVTWLEDARAMEAGIAEVLEKQVRTSVDSPAVRDGLKRHLEETRRHATLVESCLEGLGEDPSALKTGMASLGGKLQGLMAGAPEDGLVRFLLHDYAAEHMEIASYRALVMAATDAGLIRIANVCDGILREEEAMVAWLEGQLPTAVRETIAGLDT